MPDLADLFARDPFALTATDIDQIILHLRSKRSEFQIGDKTAGKQPKKAGDVPVLNLQTLGLKKPGA